MATKEKHLKLVEASPEEIPAWSESAARAFEQTDKVILVDERFCHGVGVGACKLFFNKTTNTPFIEITDEFDAWSYVVEPENAFKAFQEPFGFAPPGLIPPSHDLLAKREG